MWRKPGYKWHQLWISQKRRDRTEVLNKGEKKIKLINQTYSQEFLFLPLSLVTLGILMVLQPFSDSARVWEQKQLLCMAMRKLFLTAKVPFPPTPNRTTVHFLDLNADTQVVSLLSNPGWISKRSMGDVTASPSPRVTSGEDVDRQFILLLPSVTPSLPLLSNQTRRTRNLRRYKSFQPFQTCFS